MNQQIVLHIERLVIDGLVLAHQQRTQVQEALAAELTRLLAVDGLAAALQTEGMYHRLKAGDIEVQQEIEPQSLGKQIAQAVYEGIKP